MSRQEQLAETGYVMLSGLLDEQWLSVLKDEAARFASSDRSGLSVQVQLVHRSLRVRQFVTHGPQMDAVIELLGPDVCFTHQQFVIKTTADSDVPWHQDNGYGTLEPPNDLTVWIALDDCDEDNGCLWVLPGSQAGGLLEHKPEGGLLRAQTNIATAGVPLPMSAGDAVLFNSLLLHRSSPNLSSRPRVAMYLRYCHPDVRMAKQGYRPVLEDGFSWMVAGEAPPI